MSTPFRAPWLVRLALVGASLLLFVIACATPAVYFDSTSHEPWPGVMTLILGAFGLFTGQFAWLANPFYAIALVLVLVRQWIAAATVAAIALLVALTSLLLLGETVPLDEAGVNKATVTGFGPGFYVWLASILLVAVGSLTLRFYERSGAPSR
jgi:hypothetical protein